MPAPEKGLFLYTIYRCKCFFLIITLGEIKQTISARDERLKSVIREIQEQKKVMMESAVSEDKEMKTGFWGRLFGK